MLTYITQIYSVLTVSSTHIIFAYITLKRSKNIGIVDSIDAVIMERKIWKTAIFTHENAN